MAEETKVMSEMMKNQSDVLTLANSSTTPDFVSRLVAAEANSSYLTKFVSSINFAGLDEFHENPAIS